MSLSPLEDKTNGSRHQPWALRNISLGMPTLPVCGAHWNLSPVQGGRKHGVAARHSDSPELKSVLCLLLAGVTLLRLFYFLLSKKGDDNYSTVSRECCEGKNANVDANTMQICLVDPK